MMTNERIEELTVAAETIYAYCDKKNGFYSGVFKDQVTNRTYSRWNNFTGAKSELEKKLNRTLSKAEVTILSLAVGFGPTPCLTNEMRKYAFESLWTRIKPDQRAGTFQPMMTVLTSFY